MALVEHVIDHQQAGARQIQRRQFGVLDQRRVRVQQAEVVGIAFEMQRIQWPARQPAVLHQGALQALRQRLATPQDADQRDLAAAVEQRRRLARHLLDHHLELACRVQAEAFAGRLVVHGISRSQNG
ncbi:hypothetical protein D3C78_1435980 [compost metagenome]